MLTLKNFEKQIPETILKRGKEYYEKGKVKSLEQTDENLWEAEVKGSVNYELEIELKNSNQITDYICDCPFEGGTCKHVVAALYAINEAIKTPEPGQTKVSPKVTLEYLLQKVTLPEYQDFIRQYALKNKTFKTEFEIWFADKDDRIDVSEKYEKLVKKIIQNSSDGGYVTYYDAYSLSHEVGKLLITGKNLVKKDNYRDAFALVKPVLTSMMEIVPYSDDSNGDIGAIIMEAIELIGVIASENKTALELKEQVFDFLKTELSRKLYFEYGDFGYDLFPVFLALAVQLSKADEFLAFIAGQISNSTGKYDDYHREFFQKQKIAFLKETGKTTEVEKLTEEHLDIVEVREGEVNKAIAKKDFITAKKLIADGIKIAEAKKHPGTVSEWEKELLRIAVLEKDTETIRYYSKSFAFDRWFNKEYYNQWKSTFSPAEWADVIEKHIEETIETVKREHAKDKGKLWYSRNPPLLDELAPIYIEEKYWDRLLALVKKEDTLEAVWKYHDWLAKIYPAELLQIYSPLFESRGDRANGRGDYADLAAKMKKAIKDIAGGKEKIMTIAQKLKLKYPRRPAMVEELNKILK